MDHLPIPEGARHSLLLYLNHKEYDNDTFADYPERQGWSRSELSGQISSKTGERYGGRSQHEVDSFFQTWLFFGVLIRAFRCLGIKVTTEDFVTVSSETGNSYLSTAKLNGYIESWRKKKAYGDIKQTYDDEKKSHTDYLTSMLKSQTKKNYKERHLAPVESVLDDHRRFVTKYLSRDSGVSPEVIVACVTLQYTMSYWARGLHHSNWSDDDGLRTAADDYTATSWMHGKMVHIGWCPAEAGKFMRDHDLASQYYLSCLPSPRYEDDHSRCTDETQRCGYTNSNWTYKTQHVRKDCKCDMIDTSREVVDIIKSGKIPLITYQYRKLKVVPFDSKKHRYVAISHVWSDGLGNEKRNSLPECQLELLQWRVVEVDGLRRFTEAHRHGRRSTGSDKYSETSFAGFWMDTLCIPVAKEHRDLRDSQIQKMRKIYKNASATLVLDSWLTAIPRSTDVLEKSAKLYASNWQHRLWTCQEGVLAQNLYFQFSDDPQTLKAIEEEDMRRRKDPARCRLPENVLGSIPAFYDQGISEMDLEYRVPPILRAIRPRTTSKAKDETICIATLLGLSPEKLLKITNGGDIDHVCEKRMAKLVDMVGTWPQGLIFTTLPRLSITGYRWAPKSFLGTNLSDEMFEPGDHDIDRDMTNWEGKPVIENHGLLVAFPTYKLGKVKEAGDNYLYISNGDKHFKLIRDKGDFKTGKEYVILRSPGTKPIQAVVCVKDGIVKKSSKTMPWDVPKLKYVSHAVMVSRTSEKQGSTSFKYVKKDEWIIG